MYVCVYSIYIYVSMYICGESYYVIHCIYNYVMKFAKVIFLITLEPTQNTHQQINTILTWLDFTNKRH